MVELDKKEINKDIKKLPKEEMIFVMRFRLLSSEQKMNLILDLDRALEEECGEEGSRIFDDIFA